MAPYTSNFESLVLKTAPPLHPEWVAHERDVRSKLPKKEYASPLERQPDYAKDCRDMYDRQTAPGARDHHLTEGIARTDFTIPSSVDGVGIPVMQLDLTEYKDAEPEIVIIYYHGGGMRVGNADSEELVCRRMVKSGIGRIRLYSIGYRLKPVHPTQTCHSDSLDGFNAFKDKAPKIILTGSSSGSAAVGRISHHAEKGTFHGVIMRCPSLGDAVCGMEYIPEKWRPYHTSCNDSFCTSLLGYVSRDSPRDGMDKLPLEATKEELAGQPRTWIQLTTNDTVYSDGLCYAMALQEAGVEVQVDVATGWPHTFWLQAAELDGALECEEALMEGLKWVAQ
jgi:acetyl esterase/lipase